MSTETCILTTKDFTILEVMRDRCLGHDDPLAPILKRKIETAVVVFRDDVPENVVTLSSRVTFRVDGREPDTRVLSHDRMTSPVGLFLPITTPRGLALLGLSEGQDFRLSNQEGVEERIVLEKVHYQPEAAKREKASMAGIPPVAPGKPVLKLVRGAYYDRPEPVLVDPNGFDDPGPSAA
jgi:regulator of nucleoside diphosphate kinase